MQITGPERSPDAHGNIFSQDLAEKMKIEIRIDRSIAQRRIGRHGKPSVFIGFRLIGHVQKKLAQRFDLGKNRLMTIGQHSFCKKELGTKRVDPACVLPT